MSLPDWREEPIAKTHDRASFDCGERPLNEFLRRHARQSHDRGAAKTFLAISKSDGKTILGFYSLCPASLEYARAPEIVRKGLARHEIPVQFIPRSSGNVSRASSPRMNFALMLPGSTGDRLSRSRIPWAGFRCGGGNGF
jgi:hypothetical protein